MDQLLINDEPAQRTGPTGPRTPEGKAKSSRNSFKHGCRSEQTVLPDEDPAAFEATVQHWFSQYEADTPAAITLVEKLARADWQLQRNQKRLDEVEWQLPGNAQHWTEDQQKRYATFSRYFTTAERSFLRYFKEVEAFYHRIHRGDQARQLAFAKLAVVQFKSLDKADEAAVKQLRAEQVLEVEVIDGSCQTFYYPSNEELLDQVAKRSVPPLYITRWVCFPEDIVPPEYAWAQPVPEKPGLAPRLMQRMLWPQWLELIQREKATGTGHAGPLS